MVLEFDIFKYSIGTFLNLYITVLSAAGAARPKVDFYLLRHEKLKTYIIITKISFGIN